MTNPTSDSSMEFDNLNKQSNHWRESVSSALRLRLIHKLVQALVPKALPGHMHDPRLAKCRDYCTRTENICYKTANNRAEYYNMIAENIYRMKKDIERIREGRRDADVIDEVIDRIRNL